jgi:hypothetical protein
MSIWPSASRHGQGRNATPLTIRAAETRHADLDLHLAILRDGNLPLLLPYQRIATDGHGHTQASQPRRTTPPTIPRQSQSHSPLGGPVLRGRRSPSA